MATDVLWVGENEDRDFLKDLRGFTQSLDAWQMSLDLSNDDAGRAIRLLEGSYQLLDAPGPNCFRCPSCGHQRFAVIEGEHDGSPLLGMACGSCDSYGVVAPAEL